MTLDVSKMKMGPHNDYPDYGNATKLINTTQRSSLDYKLLSTNSRWVAEMVQSHRLLYAGPEISPALSHYTETGQ